MVLDRTMFHFRNLAATWLDQAQRNNLLTDCSSAGTQGWEGQREKEEGMRGRGKEGRGEKGSTEKKRVRRRLRREEREDGEQEGEKERSKRKE